jgi:hypothetical protein
MYFPTWEKSQLFPDRTESSQSLTPSTALALCLAPPPQSLSATRRGETRPSGPRDMQQHHHLPTLGSTNQWLLLTRPHSKYFTSVGLFNPCPNPIRINTIIMPYYR